jgi:single-strand DNA-binding protein
MNNWNFTGNLGRDAEQKFIPSGESVVSFSVAVKSGYGEKASTTWAKCTIWGKRGEAVAQYLTKGQLVGVSGEATLREYEKKDGTTGASLEVRVNDLTLLGKRDDSIPRDAAPETKPGANVPAAEYDDQIPF